MGRNEVGFEIPDTFGLTEYFVSDIVTEIDGPNVRLICGVRRGGQMHWLYSVVIRSDRLDIICRKLGDIVSDTRALAKVVAGQAH